MTQLSDLRDLAEDHSISIVVLLQRALVVANERRADARWIWRELEGYQTADDLPSYRWVYGQLHSWDRYNGLRPVLIRSDALANALARRPIGDRIATVEELIRSTPSGEPIEMRLPAPVLAGFVAELGRDDVQLPYLVDRSQYVSIVDAVRTRVVSWSLTVADG